LIELVNPGTHIDFLGARRICAMVSVALIVIGIAAIPVRGFRTGIDFAGGTELQIRFTADIARGQELVAAIYLMGELRWCSRHRLSPGGAVRSVPHAVMS